MLFQRTQLHDAWLIRLELLGDAVLDVGDAAETEHRDCAGNDEHSQEQQDDRYKHRNPNRKQFAVFVHFVAFPG